MDAAGNLTDPATSRGIEYKVRATFYALTPEETYVENVKDIPDIVTETLPIMLLITFVELVILRARGEGDKFRLHNTVINYCTGITNEVGRNFIFRGLEFSAYLWVYNNCRLVTLPWNSFFTYVFAMLGVDLCAYWWHRMAHELSFMWAAHYVHHNSEDFNSSVGARVSITMRPFKWVYFLPLAVVGLPPSTYLIHVQLGFVWAFWVHNAVWPKTHKIVPVLGHIIEYVMSTPSHHRVHHGVNKYCIDKNYGAAFIIWDRMFGTFVEEKEDEELTYGSIAQKDNNHIWGLQADPWRELWSRVAAAKTPGDKLRTVVYGPGWSSGQPRLGNIDDIPDVRGRKKHGFIAPRLVSLYLAVHCFVIFIGVFEMSGRVTQINEWLPPLYVAYITLAYGSMGYMYIADHDFLWLEPFRLLLSLPIIYPLHMFQAPVYIALVLSVNVASLLIWPIVRSQVLSMTAKKTT